MRKVKVSVIVPCYNAVNTLDWCLNSLINQTFVDIEIICVNDGSTDNTLDILNKYKKKDKRITVINKNNGGVSSARNVGIKHAIGEYIIFIDSDDYVDVNMISDMYNVSINTKSEIVKCNRCDVYNAFSKKEIIISRKPIWDEVITIEKNNFESEIFVEFFGRSRLCNVFTMLISRELIISNKIYFCTDLKVDEDEIFAIQLFSKANRFTYIPKCYYYYVKGLTGLTGSGTNIYDRYSSRKEHINILIDISKNWKIDCYEELLQNKIGFIGIYTAMQTSIKSNKYSKKEQYNLFKLIVNDEVFKDAIIKKNNSVLLYPEKVFSKLIRWHMIKMCFIYSRLFEKIVQKYRNKFEIFRGKRN